MAVEIIGTDDLKKKQVTCSNCGSVLQYMPCDARREKRTDYTGDTDMVSVIDCPKCLKNITVAG